MAEPRRESRLRWQRRRRFTMEERRDAILNAALDVFSERGFAAARLDDVAAKAGVAKGTLYLYFEDKEALFEQLLKKAVQPVLTRLADLSARENVPAQTVFSAILELFQTEVLGSPREKIVRLVISEGQRFPQLAKYYHSEVISRGLPIIRALAERAKARGELTSDALVNFPQLFFAPVLMSIVWNSLFSEFDRLDISGLLAAHKKILFKPEGQV